VQSQGTERELPKEAASTEREQLERSAEMFEMILHTAPDDAQNYLALKEIYRQLGRHDDFKRVVKGLAEVYLASGQRQHAAREYVDILEVDSTDQEVASKLQELGYASTELPLLKVEARLKEIRSEYEQKLKELPEAEQALAKASSKARDVRNGHDKESHRIVQAVEEEIERETQQLIEKQERWLNEGRTDVFNQVARSLKKEADRIIETDQYGKIGKSVKEAEKLLASTDRVFQQEWRRVSQQREREFHERFEELKRKKEAKLHSAWQEVVARAEQDEAAADRGLQEVKEELEKLEDELREKEKLLKGGQEALSGQASPETRLKDGQPSTEVVVAASRPTMASDVLPEEEMAEHAARRHARDEAGKTLGAILIQQGLVSRPHLEEAIAKQKSDHRPIGGILVESGYATEEDIINALVEQAGVPYLALATYEINDDVARTFPKELALKYSLMPVDRIAGSLLVAMGIPLNKEQKQDVQQHVRGLKITYFVSSWSDIKAKHEQHYG